MAGEPCYTNSHNMDGFQNNKPDGTNMMTMAASSDLMEGQEEAITVDEVFLFASSALALSADEVVLSSSVESTPSVRRVRDLFRALEVMGKNQRKEGKEGRKEGMVEGKKQGSIEGNRKDRRIEEKERRKEGMVEGSYEGNRKNRSKEGKEGKKEETVEGSTDGNRKDRRNEGKEGRKEGMVEGSNGEEEEMTVVGMDPLDFVDYGSCVSVRVRNMFVALGADQWMGSKRGGKVSKDKDKDGENEWEAGRSYGESKERKETDRKETERKETERMERKENDGNRKDCRKEGKEERKEGTVVVVGSNEGNRKDLRKEGKKGMVVVVGSVEDNRKDCRKEGKEERKEGTMVAGMDPLMFVSSGSGVTGRVCSMFAALEVGKRKGAKRGWEVLKDRDGGKEKEETEGKEMKRKETGRKEMERKEFERKKMEEKEMEGKAKARKVIERKKKERKKMTVVGMDSSRVSVRVRDMFAALGAVQWKGYKREASKDKDGGNRREAGLSYEEDNREKKVMERKEMNRKESERKKTDRKETERKEMERKELEKREVESKEDEWKETGKKEMVEGERICGRPDGVVGHILEDMSSPVLGGAILEWACRINAICVEFGCLQGRLKGELMMCLENIKEGTILLVGRSSRFCERRSLRECAAVDIPQGTTMDPSLGGSDASLSPFVEDSPLPPLTQRFRRLVVGNSGDRLSSIIRSPLPMVNRGEVVETGGEDYKGGRHQDGANGRMERKEMERKELVRKETDSKELDRKKVERKEGRMAVESLPSVHGRVCNLSAALGDVRTGRKELKRKEIVRKEMDRKKVERKDIERKEAERRRSWKRRRWKGRIWE